MADGLRTVLIGAGRVGVGYAADRAMARYFRFSTHAQVLDEHPMYDWVAVVDPSAEARQRVQAGWKVPVVTASLEEARAREPEVAVLAVEPDLRLEVIERLPSLRGVLVEKPLGRTSRQAAAFLAACEARGITVQVNLWRRADEGFRALAAGALTERIGEPQAITAVYGNGLENNGTHVVDFVRMLAGELESVCAWSPPVVAGPMPGDVDVAFGGRLASGATFSCQPLDFGRYREVGVDIWGTSGRLAIVLEGLVVLAYERRPNRAVEADWEVASDSPESIPTTVGSAFFHMYTNLADALVGSDELWSTGASALRSTRVVEGVLESARSGGPVDLR